MVLLFCGAVLFSGFLRSTFVYIGSNLAYSTSSEISKLLFTRMLNFKYEKLMNLNNSFIVDCIYNRSNIIANGIVLPTIYFFNALILCLIFFLAFLLSEVNIIYILYVFTSLSFLYFLVMLCTHKYKISNAKNISDQSQQVIKVINESFGAIRDVIIGNHFSTFIKIFCNAEVQWRKAQASNQFLALSPKYMVEAIGICVIVIAAQIMESENGAKGFNLPAFTAIIFGAQKLIPVFQQAYSAIVTIQVSRPSLEMALKILIEKNENTQASTLTTLKFEKSLEFRNVSFSYEKEAVPILDDINLLIKPGAKIGIIGKTGAGKSTFIDILSNLLEPTSGSIALDGRILTPSEFIAYRQLISHIPQSVYLSDESILKNIAFGVNEEDIDYQRVVNSAKIAELLPEIEKFEGGFNAIVGDRGSRLSGGQQQRIGIARAIYAQKKILILDEATSALDIVTEKKVIDNIQLAYSEAVQVMVTHKRSTLLYCDEVFEISDLKLKRIKIN